MIFNKSVLRNVDSITSYDAHHDAGYNVDSSTPQCDNWISHVKYDLNINDLEIRYPSWKPWAMQVEPKPTFNLTRIVDSVEPDEKIYYRVFICRSGAWVPPWLDNEFELFCNKCPAGRYQGCMYYLDNVNNRHWDTRVSLQIAEETKYILKEKKHG